jgi:hypothetical protein
MSDNFYQVAEVLHLIWTAPTGRSPDEPGYPMRGQPSDRPHVTGLPNHHDIAVFQHDILLQVHTLNDFLIFEIQ